MLFHKSETNPFFLIIHSYKKSHLSAIPCVGSSSGWVAVVVGGVVMEAVSRSIQKRKRLKNTD